MNARTHYTATPLVALRSMDQPEYLSEHEKPRGLWYSVDGEWEEWCQSEMPHWLEGGILYAIELGSENLLRITTVEEFDAFHERYRREVKWSIPMPFKSYAIDWRAVAERYDGIEIAPYQYERRLHFESSWYYGWDCASGVVWRPRDMTFRLVRDDRVTEPHASAPVPTVQ